MDAEAPWLPRELACPLAWAEGAIVPMADAAYCADLGLPNMQSGVVSKDMAGALRGDSQLRLEDDHPDAQTIRRKVEEYNNALPQKVLDYHIRLFSRETDAQMRTVRAVDRLSNAPDVPVSMPPIGIRYEYGPSVTQAKMDRWEADVRNEKDLKLQDLRDATRGCATRARHTHDHLSEEGQASLVKLLDGEEGDDAGAEKEPALGDPSYDWDGATRNGFCKQKSCRVCAGASRRAVR
eukprot:COSAG04_NODE_529_length_13029_cov_3.203248_8_plen_237_part_00